MQRKSGVGLCNWLVTPSMTSHFGLGGAYGVMWLGCLGTVCCLLARGMIGKERENGKHCRFNACGMPEDASRSSIASGVPSNRCVISNNHSELIVESSPCYSVSVG